MLHVIATLLAN